MLVLLLLFVFACYCPLHGASVSPQHVGGLRGAVAAAERGDTLTLAAGRYFGPQNCNVTIDKDLTIIGMEGRDATIIDCEGRSRCLVISASTRIHVRIEGVHLKNGVSPNVNPFSAATRSSVHILRKEVTFE